MSGTSAAMAEVQRHLRRVQRSDVTVCLRGETGTGKDFLARLIHRRGARRRGPFISVNCLANLQESELFGRPGDPSLGEQGRRPGKFEQANQGTLFLDNLDELSLPVQAMLLRVVEDSQDPLRRRRRGRAHRCAESSARRAETWSATSPRASFAPISSSVSSAM